MIYQKVTKDDTEYRDLALDPNQSEDGLVVGDNSISQAIHTLSKIEKRSFFNEPWLGVRLKSLLKRPMSTLIADNLVVNSVLDINEQEPRTSIEIADVHSVVDMRNRTYHVLLRSELYVDLEFIT